jgi:hypothetical protein
MKKAEQTAIAINEVKYRITRCSEPRITAQEPHNSRWQLRRNRVKNVAGKRIILRSGYKNQDLQGVVGLAGKALKGLR